MKHLTIKEQIKTLETTLDILNTYYEFTNNDIRLKRKISEAGDTIEYLKEMLQSTGVK